MGREFEVQEDTYEKIIRKSKIYPHFTKEQEILFNQLSHFGYKLTSFLSHPFAFYVYCNSKNRNSGRIDAYLKVASKKRRYQLVTATRALLTLTVMKENFLSSTPFLVNRFDSFL